MPAPQTCHHAVRPATREDRRAISQVVGRAFFDDPVAVHFFPDESRRRARFGAFAGIAMDQFAAHGATWVDESVRGAAIWQAPAPARPGIGSQLALALRLLWLMRSDIGKAARFAETVEAERPEADHWYLAILGTEPEAQGQGIGSALLEPMLERCDREGVGAYLESSKESNVPFYRRHGFEVTGTLEIEAGPTLWPMWRAPRAPAD